MGEPAFPLPLASDPDVLVAALETASATWSRGDAREAIRWLRHAANLAGDLGLQSRAVVLARATAALMQHHGVPSPASGEKSGAGNPLLERTAVSPGMRAADQERGSAPAQPRQAFARTARSADPRGLDGAVPQKPPAFLTRTAASPGVEPPPASETSGAQGDAAADWPRRGVYQAARPAPHSAADTVAAPQGALSVLPAAISVYGPGGPKAFEREPDTTPNAGLLPRQAVRVALRALPPEQGHGWLATPLAEGESPAAGAEEGVLVALAPGPRLLETPSAERASRGEDPG